MAFRFPRYRLPLVLLCFFAQRSIRLCIPMMTMTDWITSGSWQLGDLEKQRLQACLELWKGDSILDVGCRDGTLALTLAQAQPQLRITGVDSDASSIDWANTTAVKMGLDNCTFHTMDI